MKKTIITMFCLSIISLNIYAQEPPNPPTPPRPPRIHRISQSVEKHGNVFNLGIGVGGYTGNYGYIGRSLPVLNFNYELDVARNFTLAPFVSFCTYTNKYYWGNNNHPYDYYTFRETIIPMGIKGTYYFDQLLKANPKWDFYLAASIGFAIENSNWSNNYYGDKNYYSNANPLFLDIHIGTEYHINRRIGAILDLSPSVSTIGIAIHQLKYLD